MKINPQDFILQQKTSVEDLFYTLEGEHDALDDQGYPTVAGSKLDRVFAKAIYGRKPRELKINNGVNRISYRYYILANPEKIPYNPKKLHSVEKKDKLSFVNNVCKEGWSFIEVSKTAFDKYLMFLKTKNLKWLKETQRELK
jgi:hypothetical protein